MTLPFKTRIRTKPAAIGTLITQGSMEVAEALARCGFDWLFIDMEHGALDITAMHGLVRAIGEHCSVIVRVPENSKLWIGKVLDTGCDGIIVPLVNSAAEARAAVAAAKYPPQGTRGAGVTRAHGYGAGFAEYVARANDDITVIVQIEHIAAVQQVQEIIAVPGVDGVLVGPYDLSGSMGRLGEVTDPEVEAAINTVLRTCAQHAMPAGMFTVNPDDVPALLAKGISFLAVGTELSLVTGAAIRVIENARRATSS